MGAGKKGQLKEGKEESVDQKLLVVSVEQDIRSVMCVPHFWAGMTSELGRW